MAVVVSFFFFGWWLGFLIIFYEADEGQREKEVVKLIF